MKRRKIFFLIIFLLMILSSSKSQTLHSFNKFDKIVLDAGHGGYDSGARGSNSREKDITLSITLMTGSLIKKNLPELDVIYTRTEDKFMPLNERARIANENEADLFISIHCNSHTSTKPFGAETYVLGIHKTAENLEVAKTENAAILMEDNYNETYDGFDPDSDESYIVLNMYQSTSIEQSIQFSMYVQKQMKESVNLYDRGVKQAGFVVLYLTTMPGALVETGFLSNPAEEQFLLDTANQAKIANAIYQAVHEYKNHIDELNMLSLENQSKLESDKNKKPVTEYRIWFASSDKLLPFDHKIFKGLYTILAYYDNGKYQYTFGAEWSEDEINRQLQVYRNSQYGNKQQKKQARVIEVNVFE